MNVCVLPQRAVNPGARWVGLEVCFYENILYIFEILVMKTFSL